MANGGIIGKVNNPTSSTATGVWQQEEQYEAVRDGTWPSRPLFTTKSLRFNDGSSDKLTRTQSNGNRQKFTLSTWLKRSALNTTSPNIIKAGANDGTRNMLRFEGTNQLRFYGVDASVGSGASIDIKTNRVFTDPSAWYHIVVAVDTTQGTASNRIKIYVNGVQETSFASNTIPNQNTNTQFNLNGIVMAIGASSFGSASEYFDGSMSHVHFSDGYVLAPTVFGSVDSTTGEWKINTAPSFTLGTNGFTILKDGNTITDQSANSNNFSLGSGAVTNTKDCPDNVMATLNPLDNYFAGGTFSNGNNTVTTINNGYTYNTSTIGVNSGKFYWEVKWTAQPTGSSNQVLIGIAKRPAPDSTTWLGVIPYAYGYQGSDGHVKNNNGNASGSVSTTYSIGDIISVAIDLDNNKIHFAKNGTYTNSSNPANNSGGVTITAADSTSGDSGFYFAAFGDGNNSLQETGQFNFGNGFFGTTAVTTNSGNGYAGAEGASKFNYAVPSGYSALNTKGLNQ